MLFGYYGADGYICNIPEYKDLALVAISQLHSWHDSNLDNWNIGLTNTRSNSLYLTLTLQPGKNAVKIMR